MSTDMGDGGAVELFAVTARKSGIGGGQPEDAAVESRTTPRLFRRVGRRLAHRRRLAPQGRKIRFQPRFQIEKPDLATFAQQPAPRIGVFQREEAQASFRLAIARAQPDPDPGSQRSGVKARD